MATAHRHRSRYLDNIDRMGTLTPVYGYGCRPLTCSEDPGLILMARYVDNILDLPVYCRPPFECCAPSQDFVEIDCLPPLGVSRRLRVRVKAFNQYCNAPECRPFDLVYEEASHTWTGSIGFPGGTLNLALSCAPGIPGVTDPIFTLALTGCETQTQDVGGVLCLRPLILSQSFTTNPAGCCKCPQEAITTITVDITGGCLPRHLGRLIGFEGDLPVYAFGECCDRPTFPAPNCCSRMPCTLVATVTAGSECACLNGLVVTMTRTGPGPGDGVRYAGVTLNACNGHDIGVIFLCETNPLIICPPHGFPSCDDGRFRSGIGRVVLTCDDLGTALIVTCDGNVPPGPPPSGGACAFQPVCDCGLGGGPVDILIAGIFIKTFTNCPCGLNESFHGISIRITE